MVKTVQSSNWVRMVDWMRSSVSRSIAAVASSRIRILVFLKRARAKHTSCLWPTLEAWRAFKVSSDNYYCLYYLSIIDNCGLPEVLSPLWTLQLQLCWIVANKLVKVGMLQRFPHLFVIVLVKRIQVHSESAWEQNRLLQQEKTPKNKHKNKTQRQSDTNQLSQLHSLHQDSIISRYCTWIMMCI